MLHPYCIKIIAEIQTQQSNGIYVFSQPLKFFMSSAEKPPTDIDSLPLSGTALRMETVL